VKKANNFFISFMAMFFAAGFFAAAGLSAFDGEVKLNLHSTDERVPRISEPVIDPALIIPPVARQPAVSQPTVRQPDAQASQNAAPLANRPGQGKWYVQLGAYAQPGHLQEQLGRIGPGYPIAIEKIGTDAAPMFRLMIGPLGDGESRAVLQRFQSLNYKDAFRKHIP
jgi:cell division septation protein DedD